MLSNIHGRLPFWGWYQQQTEDPRPAIPTVHSLNENKTSCYHLADCFSHTNYLVTYITIHQLQPYATRASRPNFRNNSGEWLEISVSHPCLLPCWHTVVCSRHGGYHVTSGDGIRRIVSIHHSLENELYSNSVDFVHIITVSISKCYFNSF